MGSYGHRGRILGPELEIGMLFTLLHTWSLKTIQDSRTCVLQEPNVNLDYMMSEVHSYTCSFAPVYAPVHL